MHVIGINAVTSISLKIATTKSIRNSKVIGIATHVFNAFPRVPIYTGPASKMI